MDKIKINLSKTQYAKLNADALTFGFLKKGKQEANLNSFLNLLIANAYLSRYEKERRIHDHLYESFKSYAPKDAALSEMMDYINGVLYEGYLEREDVGHSCFISLRPNIEQASLFATIENEELSFNKQSMSGYLRSLIDDYLRLSGAEREKLLFKKETEMILDAFKSSRKLRIKNEKIDQVMRPFLFDSNEERSFNYLYGDLSGGAAFYPRSVHLFKLHDSLSLLPEYFSFDEKETAALEQRLQEDGLAYAGDRSILALVNFDKEGFKMLKLIYYMRPSYEVLDERNPYQIKVRFHASEMNLFQYLSRFGPHAFILSPEKLQTDLYAFYSHAYQSYKKRLPLPSLSKK
jgi:hypothetical protein